MLKTDVSNNSTMQQDISKLMRSFESLKREVQGVARGVVNVADSGLDDMQHSAKSAVNTVGDAITGAKDAAVDQYESAKAAVSDAKDSVKGFVKDYPVATVGIATALGVTFIMAIMRYAKA